ncbi:hypothetical protein HYV64_03760 [Candidatus Shapirobacteria bacterium]|nr:hypothetical protein [Candidatus Shapirobacteria bacterium]
MAIEQLSINAEQKEEIQSATKNSSVSAEWNSLSETERGRNNANLLKNGGALILQSGNHYRLVCIDNTSRLVIFDPLLGKVTPINSETVYDYARPETIGRTGAVIIELPTFKGQDEDFIMN